MKSKEFTLYHVFLQASQGKRDVYDVSFLQAYNGKKAPNLDYLLEEVEMPDGTKRRRCKDICMDCGAFEAYAHGYSIDIDPYIEYCNQYSKHLTWFCALDSIPIFNKGLSSQEAAKISGEETWKNFLYMWDRVKEPEKMAWVYHGPEPLENIYRAMTWRDPKTGKGLGAVCFAMSNSSDIERDLSLIYYVNKVVEETGYTGKIHLLGLQREKVAKESPYVTSSDSSSSIRFAVAGILQVNGQQVKVAKTTKLNHKEPIATIYHPGVREGLIAKAKELGLEVDIDNITTEQIWYWNCLQRTQDFKNACSVRVKTSRSLLRNIKRC